MALSRNRVTRTPAAAEEHAAQVAQEDPATTEEQTPPFEANKEQLSADLETAAENEANVEAELAKQAKREAAAKAALNGKPASTEMATHKPTNAAPAAGKGNVLKELEATGFEGLEIGFGSFPVVKLENEGIFMTTEDDELGTEFECIVQSTRAKYLYANTKCEKKDEEAVYSYDMVTDSNTGEPIEDVIAEWASKGWGSEIRPYVECVAILVTDGEPGDMILLSIPKASRARISGFFGQNSMKYGLAPNQYVMRCVVGEKTKNADFNFYPWKFEFVRAL